MSRTSRRFVSLMLTLLLTVSWGRAAPAAETKGALTWDLVTVGPDTDLFSLWGHSALCVSKGSFESGWCFDFGVAREDDPAKLAIGTLRGEALFAVIKIPAQVLLSSIQFRDTWRQRIELDPARGRELLAELEATLDARRGYAYRPLSRNCTTELRDRLDRALLGRLRQGAQERSGVPLRRAAEGGLSGQVLPLALLALAGGSTLDRPSTEWERMALPSGLMQAVHARLSAAPSRVFSRMGAPPPTSPQAGRITLLVLSLLGSALYVWLLRRAPAKRPLLERTLAGWLLVLSLVPLVGATSTLPSLHTNWMLAVLVPLDVLLALGPRFGVWQKRYVELRLGSLVLLALAMLGGFIAQPLAIGLVLAAAPLATWRIGRVQAGATRADTAPVAAQT